MAAGISATHWLRLLREATPGYAAQPYQHLARRVLMAQRRDQLDRRAFATLFIAGFTGAVRKS